MGTCFNCDSKEELENLFGYTICTPCKKKMGLFTDETIARHIEQFGKENYINDIEKRLDFIDKDFKKKRIKLLAILERVKP